jgi:quercetin dioxygenase-like cupin family protein
MAENEQARIFTVEDFIKEDATRTVVATYRDEDVVTLVEWIDPGKEFEPPHWHPEAAHIFVFMSSEGEALVGNGKWEPVRAGQFIVNPRNRVHAMRNTSTTERLVWACVHVTHGLPYVVNEVGEEHE